MKHRFIPNKITKIIALALALCLFVGVIAYFTDRVTEDANITTVTLGITPEPDPGADPDDPGKDPEDYKDPTPDNPDDDLTNWWAYLNSRAKVNYNPGDKMDLSFILKNSGSMAVETRETFIITSTVPMTNGNPEFRLYTAVSQNADTGEWTGTATTGVTMTRISDTQYKFVVANSTIAKGASSEKSYYIVFAGSAGNNFQGATCKVDYLAEAMQEGGDWTVAATGTVSMGGSSYPAVPAA